MSKNFKIFLTIFYFKNFIRRRNANEAHFYSQKIEIEMEFFSICHRNRNRNFQNLNYRNRNRLTKFRV